MNPTVAILTLLLLAPCAPNFACGADPGSKRWQEITALTDAKTHLAPATWTLDKYPDAKTLKAHSKVVLLDVKGPGVVTAFHVSDQSGCDAGKLMLRVWYDAEQQPAIEMPLMDFLGNIEAKAKPFSTIYFSRVRRSHNFRLPLPFREGIPGQPHLKSFPSVCLRDANRSIRHVFSSVEPIPAKCPV